MKTIITVIVLALVAWGIWWFATKNDDLGTNPAAAGQGLDLGTDASLDASGDADVDLSEFQDKG